MEEGSQPMGDSVSENAEIIQMAIQGLTPQEIAEQMHLSLTVVQASLLREGIVWSMMDERHARTRGRPRVPLSPGQQRFIEAGSRFGLSHSRISLLVAASTTRVRRHLIEQGIYTPPYYAKDTSTSASASANIGTTPYTIRPGQTPIHPRYIRAAQMYLAGEYVMDICSVLDISTSALYRTLRRLGIELRGSGRREKSS